MSQSFDDRIKESLEIRAAGECLKCGRKPFWLPKWLLSRGVESGKTRETIDKWLMRPAKFIDRFLGRRLEGLTGPGGIRAVAVVTTLLAVATPATELVPMSANGVGAARTTSRRSPSRARSRAEPAFWQVRSTNPISGVV